MNESLLIFIVNGEDVLIKSNTDSLLASARDAALFRTLNTGRPLDEWEVRRESGELLNTSQTIRSFGFMNNDRIFVTLKISAGGSNPLTQKHPPQTSRQS